MSGIKHWVGVIVCVGALTAVDWGAWSTFVAGNVLDTWSTERALHNGSGCYETDVLLGPHPSLTGVLTVTVFRAGVVGAVMWWNHHHRRHRLEQGLGYSIGGWWAKTAAQNMQRCGV